MRNAFIEELVLLARDNPHVALIVGDLGYSVVEPFADEFPDRFVNAGVAEQNMIGLAAGMASEGYHVFTYSIANFPTFRCAEQIRNDVAYQNHAVTIVSVGGGLAYGALGYSHHAVQDYALMRTMPDMLIAAPGDPMEVRACLRYLIKNPCPSYLRLGKSGEANIHQTVPELQPGKWVQAQNNGAETCFLTTGNGLQILKDWMKCSDVIEKSTIYSLPLWGMKFKKEQLVAMSAYKKIITIEDHLIDGGFGSWLLEAKSIEQTVGTEIKICAISDVVCGAVGNQTTLHKLGGLKLEVVIGLIS